MTSEKGEGTDARRSWEGLTAGKQGGLGTRRVFALMGIVIAWSFIIAVTAALSTGNEPTIAAPGIVAAVTRTPRTIFAPTDSPQATPAPQLTDAASATPAPQMTDSPPATIDSAWSATPDVFRPVPTSPEVSDPVADLVASIQVGYGVRLLTAGQNWGADEGSQMRNLGAVATALADMPANVRAINNNNVGGQLTFLSNDTGATEGGWEPYGSRAANYYSNDDIVGGEQVAANQIVLQPGSTAQTIVHEMMHAYQLRGQAPGDYAAGLLSPEMKSFMQTTGWTQLVSDEQVRADAASWDTLNADFSYSGTTLAYLNERGETSTLFTPNPLEAYAEAGGLYYAHSSASTLPDWPEYWGWFAANVG